MITRIRRVSGCLHTEITTGETGRPTLSRHFDQDVFQAEAAVDGWYVLLTTLTPNRPIPAITAISAAMRLLSCTKMGVTASGPLKSPYLRSTAIIRGIQLDLLDLLGLEPTQLRWPET
ncbi:hypothetical protein AB0C61_11620 [Streptomyces sp. NPDC048680]|uniref:hypothetical protein n=1 Tax=Streptomyces sp. NPDC048680 TaxID=3155492 RepID=UPI0034351C94